MPRTVRSEASRHPIRLALALGVLALLLAASLRVLQPFLVSAAWAVVIVVTGWPTMLALQQRLGGRRWAAITVLMLGLLVLLVLPVMAAVGAAVANAGEIAERIKQLGTLDLPAPPAWVAGLPVIGERLVALWQQVAAAGSDAVDLAMRAIRGVAIGVGGTAVLQSVLAGLGLAAAGVPFAALLTAVIFVSCIAQLGTPVVMLPAVIYVYWTGETGWGTALLVWSIIIGTADNVVRPLLIQRGVDLPFWMVFTGVVGGLIAFGLVGLFVGPVVLAVVGMLAERWLSGRRTGGADARPPGTD
ncbi:AI-2E family transporter [Piscinibacter sakaiensis]|uniref:AI-2E family transporter n=1 Tax=Piscinibacter sakaiensis TaxID=1547922 RepID=UPI00372B9F4E